MVCMNSKCIFWNYLIINKYFDKHILKQLMIMGDVLAKKFLEKGIKGFVLI